MSATNSTTNYNLPIFIASDSPKWLVDWNGAMNTIDSAINTVATAASGAAGDITTLQSDLQTLSGTVTTQGTSISTLTSSLSTLTGTVNTITSLIGNGEPTTTDKTIIGAINELHSDIQAIVVSTDADDVTYDNTTSGLTASNVQAAIDELNVKIESDTPTTAGRRIINVGDSYAVDNHSETDYVQVLKTLTGLTGNNFYNFSAIGSGIVRESTDHHTALELLQSNAASVTDKDTITDIIITSGLNDACYVSDQTLLAPAVEALMAYIRTTYPNARVMYGFIGYMYNQFTDDAKYERYVNTINIYYDKFRELGAKIMHGIEYICHNAQNLTTASYSHPNNEGHAAIAKFIYECMLFGSSVYKKYIEYTSGTTKILVNYDGDVVKVDIRLVDSQYASGTLSGATDIATLDNFPVRGSEGGKFNFQMFYYINNQYENGYAYFKDGHLYGGRTGDGSFNGFYALSIIMPTLSA